MSTYVLIAIDHAGRARCAFTTEPVVPDGFVRPGEIAVVLEPLDVQARHDHEV